MPLIYNFAPHHEKYMEVLLKSINGIPYNKELKQEYDIGITNSYFGMRTSTKIAKESTSGRVITLCHSMFGTQENIKRCQPTEEHEYFMIPSSWDNSNMGGFENTFRYQGHYMSLYHYNTPPSINEMDGILYLLRAESTVAEIKEHIKNLDHKKIGRASCRERV